MADTKISDLAALTATQIATLDLATLVDVSDVSMAASGTNKKATFDAVREYLKLIDGRDQLKRAW